MNIKPHPNPHHAIINLEGGEHEVVHLHALGVDLAISFQVDEAKSGVVIFTKRGMIRQDIVSGGSDVRSD